MEAEIDAREAESRERFWVTEATEPEGEQAMEARETMTRGPGGSCSEEHRERGEAAGHEG